MSLRMSAADYRRMVAAAPTTKAKPHKYRASTGAQGPDGTGGTRTYRSKLEARLAQRLEAERQIGGVVAFVPEVSVPVGQMGGKTLRHVLDQLAILEVRPDGSFVGRFVEAKGFDAPAGRRKRLAFERAYGIKVEVVG